MCSAVSREAELDTNWVMCGKAGNEMSKDHIAIVGVGNVGATTAYALLLSGLAPDIVLINRDRNGAEGEAEDISHAEPWAHYTGAPVLKIARPRRLLWLRWGPG